MVIRIAGRALAQRRAHNRRRANGSLLFGAGAGARARVRSSDSTCDNVNEILNDSGRTQTCRQMRECGCYTRQRVFHVAPLQLRPLLAGWLVRAGRIPAIDIPSLVVSRSYFHFSKTSRVRSRPIFIFSAANPLRDAQSFFFASPFWLSPFAFCLF